MQNTPDPVSAYVRGISLGQAAAARQDAANRSAQEMAIQQARAAENAILRQEQMAVQSEYHKNLIRLKEDEDRRKNEAAAARMMAQSQFEADRDSAIRSGMDPSQATRNAFLKHGPSMGVPAAVLERLTAPKPAPKVPGKLIQVPLGENKGVAYIEGGTSLHPYDTTPKAQKPALTPAQEISARTQIAKLRSEAITQMKPELDKIADALQEKLDSFAAPSGTSSQPSEPMLGGVPALGWFSDTLGSRPSVPTIQANSLPGVESAPERSAMEEQTDEETDGETDNQPKELTDEAIQYFRKQAAGDKAKARQMARDAGYSL